MTTKTLIIAEAGVNHNGSLARAKEMIDVASEAGADFVKFQTFKAERLVTKNARKADYQIQGTDDSESQYEMLKALELDYDDHVALIDYCAQRSVEFLSTGFDQESVSMLYRLGQRIFKIPSGEITNLPFLKHVGELKEKVILSTGMSCMEEVRAALDILTRSGTLLENITVLHCTSEYPTRPEDVNLQALNTLRDSLGIPVGYSDHTQGIEISIAAVAVGATIIEKHFTLDRSLPGPDHSSSLEPDELKAMIAAVRIIEAARGNGRKLPTNKELENRLVIRKSIVAADPIKKGEAFTESNLTIKRPGTGISPMSWDKVIGKLATRDFDIDEPIEI
ncbi:MAG: N-acetylneuraminate synthase [Gammaproteobacteria bacterium]